MRSYATITDAYLATLEDVLTNPDYVSSPRGQLIYEKLHYQLRVTSPSSDAIETRDPERNKVLVDYLDKEFSLYQSGTRQVSDFEKASKFWKKIANPDGTVNSAYGHLIFFDKSCGKPEFETPELLTQPDDPSHYSSKYDGDTNKGIYRSPWEWALRCLINDPDTRQAVIPFMRRDHLWRGNKDVTCTIYGNFHRRGGKLHLVIRMRSSDLVLGFPSDLPWFAYLLFKMVSDLDSRGQKVGLGTLTWSADSVHIYTRDIEKVSKMLGWNPLGDQSLAASKTA